MMRVMKFLGGLFFCLEGMGQPVHEPAENAYIKAGAYSIHFTDAFSFTSNPACLGTIKVFSCGILAERKWMLKELDNYQSTVCAPIGNGGIGISLQHSGDGDYSEQALELAYGKNLGRLEMGMRFGYLRDQAAGYPGTGFGSTGIGIRYHVSDKCITGWELGLPVFGRAGNTNPERAPQFFRMGFGYEWGTDLFLALQLVKFPGLPVNTVGSLEYRYGDALFFSFGLSSLAGAIYFKSGWKKNRLCIQLYTEYVPVLGFSPGLLLLWRGKNNQGT
jgi:hypothetical protein